MKGLKIRAVEERDLPILAGIYSRVYEVYNVGEKWAPKSALELMSYWLKRQPDLALLAELDKKVVGGFVVGVKPWWDGNHLVDGEIFVNPNYQKKGVGTELCKSMFKLALEKYHVVRWDTFTFREGFALDWYKRLGFEEIKEWAMISGDPKKVLRKL